MDDISWHHLIGPVKVITCLKQGAITKSDLDYYSVDPPGDILPAHEILLSSEVIILEGIDLTEVTAGEYVLCCLPLKIAGCDGAPARVILHRPD